MNETKYENMRGKGTDELFSKGVKASCSGFDVCGTNGLEGIAME